MALDLIKPFLLINRNEGPEGIELYSLTANETMDGPNFPHDCLCLYSDGKWGLVGKYEPAEEFGQDERCTLILVSLEEARGKVTFVYGFDENEQLVIPRRACTGFFNGNPSGDDYQIFLLERPINMEDDCILWISETNNPLGDGDVVNENDPAVFNQNNGGLVWTRHRIGIQEDFVNAFSLVFWNSSVYWISAGGIAHGFNLGSAVHTRYDLHPDVEFDDDNQGIGPRAYLSAGYGGVLYIFTNADQVWICRLSNLGNQIGLIEPIMHENSIARNALFVNRGQAALLIDIEDLNMDLEDKILQGPLPNDCQIFNFETDQWQVQKLCHRALCEALWFLSEVDDLGQEHLHYVYVPNYLEHGGGAAPPVAAAAIAEDEEEEEEEDVPVVIDKLSTILQTLSVQGMSSGSPMRNDSSGVSRAMIKERFKSFNMQFEELHRKQSQWTVPDPELRESLRLSVAEVLLPAYRSFAKSFGPLVENGKNPQKYIKYSPEELHRLLGELFQGKQFVETKR